MAGPSTGLRGAFQQPSRWGRSETGNYTLWSFEGTRQEVYNLAANFAQTLGLVYEVQESFGKYRLEVHIPWNAQGIDPATDRIDVWEFFAQHAEKDLLDARVENPNTIAKLTTGQISTIRSFLLDPPDGAAKAFPTVNDFRQNGEDNASGTNALSVYNLMQQGAKHFPVEVPALRHTITTSNQYTISYALTNLRRIHSTTTLTSVEQLPSGLFWNLPTDISSDPGLAYGWYKMFPTVQQIALLKWQIVQEWQYGLWATLIWGNPL